MNFREFVNQHEYGYGGDSLATQLATNKRNPYKWGGAIAGGLVGGIPGAIVGGLAGAGIKRAIDWARGSEHSPLATNPYFQGYWAGKRGYGSTSPDEFNGKPCGHWCQQLWLQGYEKAKSEDYYGGYSGGSGYSGASYGHRRQRYFGPSDYSYGKDRWTGEPIRRRKRHF
jgi:hypothetical protein